ncbi:hypothetical protein LX16_5328 [Stackebrandtia albiflava]|uniref:Uncharacterized protein n=1 Tax=Stackebrandtia albiflava TaxID=406432 RepID=A0A562UL76_9ACTN|nr:hypothetical protein [Stackebrandtia albiflava]TWJ06364.1 hypothetical protein LX16_5328 [Stackebrandtia albiflava]
MQDIDTGRLAVLEPDALTDLDFDLSEPGQGLAMETGDERLRKGSATSTCVTYWSASRCPSCW